MDYEQPEVYIFPSGRKYWARKKCLKALFWGITIFFIGGLILGYKWRMEQTEVETELQIRKLRDQVLFYRHNWTPMKEKQIEKSDQERKNKIKLP